MSSNSNPNMNQPNDDMQEEYTIDYQKAKPNRFAPHTKAGGRLIVLEPDVAAVFTTNEAVNTLLRALIHALPTKQATVKIAEVDTPNTPLKPAGG